MKLFVRSTVVGSIASFVLGVAAFGLATVFDAVSLYVAPSGLMIRVVGPLIPDAVVYWLGPAGGAPAGVLLILAGAFLFWAIVLGLIYFSWIKWKAQSKS